MTYFEAYLLWNIGTIGGWFIGLGVALIIVVVGVLIYYTICKSNMDIYSSWGERDKDYLKAKHNVETLRKPISLMLKVFLPCAVLLLICGSLVPNTTTVLKIIATKKGVDAIQSQTFQGYVDESASIVDNGLKLLNQEIEKKLNKKEAKP